MSLSDRDIFSLKQGWKRGFGDDDAFVDYFFAEYDTAVRNYPVKKCMAVIALLKEYDYKGKGGDVGEATPAELMVELTARILNR